MTGKIETFIRKLRNILSFIVSLLNKLLQD